MFRKGIIAASVLAALLTTAAVTTFYTSAESAEPAAAKAVQAPPAIRVAAAERRELVATLPVTGTIVAREEAFAGTDLNGLTVVELNADQGDTVKKGDVLARLDRASLDTDLAQVNASLAQAEASASQVAAQIKDAEIGVRQAEEALARARSLHGKGVAAQAQLDDAVNAHDSARAKLTVAQRALFASQAQIAVLEAQKKNIELQISKTEVRAPADGLVLARDATLGGVVSAGGPLFRIAIDGELELAAQVPETALPGVSPGMQASVSLAGRSQPVSGTVRKIEPEVDQKSRLGTVRITLEAGSDAWVGNFARGEIETARHEAVAVPGSALIFRGKDALLQVVEDNRVKTVPVTLGLRANGLVEVTAGVSEGDEFVSRAGTFVSNGDVVTPVRANETGVITQ